MSEKMIVLCEGGYNTLAYLLKMGVNPDRVFFDPILIKNYLPYIKEEDTLLVVLTGMTDFTEAEVVESLGIIQQTGVVEPVIFTPHALPFLLEQYYIYEGDLYTRPLKVVNIQKENAVRKGVLRRQKKETMVADVYFATLIKTEPPFDMRTSKDCVIVESAERPVAPYTVADYSERRFLSALKAVDMWKERV